MEIKGFEELREQWIQLRKQARIEEADTLYWDSVFPEVEKRFLENAKLKEEYDWLILPAGLESLYYILLIKAIKAKKIYFLGTHEFKERFLDDIVKRSGLKAADYIIDVIAYDKMDVADVYDKISKRLELFYDQKVILDLSRGKRIMSAGAGIVGAFFGFDLVYVDETWIDQIKRGIPGTEKLVQVKNPFEVFGDLEKREASELFNRYNYGAALHFYRRLRERVADPRKVEVEELIAEAYLHWNSFNFKAALFKMDMLIKKSNQYNIKIRPELYENLDALRVLGKGDVTLPLKLGEDFNLAIIIDLYANALRKAEVGMFEDSVSRLYRVLELVSQYRLRSHNIDSSNPDLKKYEEEYKKICKEIYGFDKNLPNEVGLKDGYILLFILKDYIIGEDSLKEMQDMFGVIRVRDTSIIAHGLQLAGEKAFKNMDKLARKFITKICQKQGKDFYDLLKKHTFIKI
ncbi:MAG: TIGR02710 family CRISPR-associated CARF protein [archaeon]